MAKKTADRKLPCIGIWNRTESCDPSAGNTLVGLWLDDATSRIEFFCAFYWNGSECVDPDESHWDRITYHSRQGDYAVASNDPVDPPDYWAECRFLIPAWGDK